MEELEKEIQAKVRSALGKPSPHIPSDIQSISSIYCDIYTQATYAEQDGLTQICGLGFGKALEVLIKDYAIFENPGDSEKIKKATLAECINNIKDDSIKGSSDLARALRNDETHYIKKYNSHDTKDLKGLIQIAMTLIEQAISRKKVDAEIERIRQKMEKDRNAN
ncbi:hypothetical protein GCM10011396_52780 [Undibacterium terreum]|uniref:DUF4145 domain-containing protein n=2 Tax=Undibacterium terreum TaxID=1224302 RepID=A0A916V011_9BURK|nr:hypothetical protein GCM10011396_52780 [Undibacterium terreum]